MPLPRTPPPTKAPLHIFAPVMTGRRRAEFQFALATSPLEESSEFKAGGIKTKNKGQVRLISQSAQLPLTGIAKYRSNGWHSCFVFRKSRFQISVLKFISIEVFCGFPEPLHESPDVVLHGGFRLQIHCSLTTLSLKAA